MRSTGVTTPFPVYASGRRGRGKKRFYSSRINDMLKQLSRRRERMSLTAKSGNRYCACTMLIQPSDALCFLSYSEIDAASSSGFGFLGTTSTRNFISSRTNFDVVGPIAAILIKCSFRTSMGTKSKCARKRGVTIRAADGAKCTIHQTPSSIERSISNHHIRTAKERAYRYRIAPHE